jgi:hypothetical protein
VVEQEVDHLGEVGAEAAGAVHPVVAEVLAIEEGLETEDEARVAERREEEPVVSAVAVAECLVEAGEGEDNCLAPLQEWDWQVWRWLEASLKGGGGLVALASCITS